MSALVMDLTAFFRKARSLWGRCPHCGLPFRLSEASISSSPEPPRGWLRRFERRESAVSAREEEVEQKAEELASQEASLADYERELRKREGTLERDARRRAKEIVSSDAGMRTLLREARQDAVQRSRSTLLGKMFERLTPFLQRLQVDPRDMRPLLDPIDYVCFGGLTVERRVEQVTFIEVKCGMSRTSPAQRSVREAIEKGRVEFQVWEIGDPRLPIAEQLSGKRRALPPRSE